MQILNDQERIIFVLRQLYDRYGYRPYRMNKFEEYDLYAKNKDFLICDNVITFTDTNGKLMALKPDVTLSIVKNTTALSGATQKLYYTENVYRVSKGAHSFRELMQVGLECLGQIDDYCICEVLLLAAKSLLTIRRECVLDISHLGLLGELICAAGIPRELQPELYKAIGEKNPHELLRLCRLSGAGEESTQLLLQLLSLSGPLAQVMPQLRTLLGVYTQLPAFAQLERITATLLQTEAAGVLRLDFSVVDNVHYYNGIVFKGFLSGIPSGVLSGGQYDKLMKKMHRSCGAIGFAVYTDLLDRLADSPSYDVDTVLLYPQGCDSAAIFQKVEQLTGQGLQVLALSQLPPELRYRQLIRFEVSELA